MDHKKVLVVVKGGVASIYADYGVEAVCIDLDDARVMSPIEMIPIHSSFVPLLAYAEIEGEWPVSDEGRKNDGDRYLLANGLQQENYVASNGQRCPVCGSDQMDASQLQADGAIALGDCHCLGCNASWQDHFQLVGFNNLDPFG